MSESKFIEFECADCREIIHVSADQSGTSIECPHCDQPVMVPSIVSAADDADALPFEDSDEFSLEALARESEPSPSADPLADLEIQHDEKDMPLTHRPTEPVGPNLPIKVDGISDSLSFDNVYGVNCRVCDTRIHVRPEQAGDMVECPICYTKVHVPPPAKDVKPDVVDDAANKAAARLQLAPLEDNDLSLSKPIDRPEVDVNFGLEPVTDDLLAPKHPPTPTTLPDSEDLDSIPEIEVIDSPPNAESNAGSALSEHKAKPSADPATKRKKKPTRRERLEAAERKRDEAESRRTFARLDSEANSIDSDGDFPEKDIASTFSAIVTMLGNAGVIWRLVLAVVAMGIGALVMESFAGIYLPDPGDEAPPLLESLFVKGQWMIFGALPYVAGLMFLWYSCGYIFRDAALGKRTVENWRNQGFAELSGTFWLFAFSFFIAGLPMIVPAFFDFPLILPLQFAIAPLFLLSAWFNQAPFAIVSVDAFGNALSNKAQWISFGLVILTLVIAAIAVAMLFWIRNVISIYAVNAIFTIIGVAVSAVLTLIFSAVSGWHCGRVVHDLGSQD